MIGAILRLLVWQVSWFSCGMAEWFTMAGSSLLFDAVGLSIFTVTVTTVALYAGLSPAPAALLGILTGTVTVTISPYNANPLYGPVAQFSTSPYSQKSFTLTAGGHASAVISVYSCRATPSGQWSFTLSVTFGAPATLTSFTDIVSGTGRYSCPLAPSP